MSAPLTNRLIGSLPPEMQKDLQRKLVSVPLPAGTHIVTPGNTPRYAYFVTSGIASVVTDLENGAPVEVGLLGRESVSGSLTLLGGQAVSTRCFMQIGGTALRMEHKDLMHEFRSNPHFHERVLQQVQYEALNLSQLSACNRLHEVNERLARWLLMVADRIEDDNLPVTQELLGQMLGTRRSTVTISLGKLQKAGLIETGRRNVHIVDRENLEQAACQCYPVMRRFHHDLYASQTSVAQHAPRWLNGNTGQPATEPRHDY